MFLRLENIRKEYDGKVAVEGLSLDVPKGSIYGIIGPNGAGKTTTIRMIMNITAPDSGRILFDNEVTRANFKDRVGYLPEERGLYKKMTVEQVILYMAELKDVPPARSLPKIGPWLERMGLAEYRKKKVEELSKGMQQKLQFITTVIHGPELLILDELFSGLDPINMELIKECILELKRSGTTILFSTHVMEQAEKLCDYICMISKGQKVIDGRMADVKSSFGQNSVQLEVEGDASFVRTFPKVLACNEFSNYLELEFAPGGDPDALLKALVGRVRVKRFALMEPSLYSIFIKMAKIDPADYNRPVEGGVK